MNHIMAVCGENNYQAYTLPKAPLWYVDNVEKIPMIAIMGKSLNS